MGKKRTPQSPKEYAEYLYCLADCAPGVRIAEYRESDVVHGRVHAFIDGVKWERRRQLKLAREAKQRLGKRIYATHSG